MRKICAVPVLLLAVVLLTAQTVTPPQAPTLTPVNWPDISTPGTAYAVAAGSWAMQAQQSINNLITQGNANIAAIQTIQQQFAVLPLKVITVPADAYSAFSGTAPLQEWGVCTPSVDIGPSAAGQTVDYSVVIPAAGNYLLAGCIASGANATASFHFEYPIGTNLGSLSSTGISSPLKDWSVFRRMPSVNPVALPSGPITIRVVFETANFNWGNFTLTQQ